MKRGRWNIGVSLLEKLARLAGNGQRDCKANYALDAARWSMVPWFCGG